jgi:DNA gyrase subunit B
MSKEYDKITALEGAEAVRLRSGMYIGDLENGYQHLLREILDNSVDEYLAGFCDKIKVTLHSDGSASVLDNGRGIPVHWMEKEKKNSLEVVFTKLHSGGKFDKDSYKFSGGLNGVGSAVVNFLSIRFRAIVKRDGKEYTIAFSKGDKIEDISETPIKSKATGTFIRFAPDPTIFGKGGKFDPKAIENKLLELSFLCRGLEIEFIDEKRKIKKVYSGQNDIGKFVEHLKNRELISQPIVFTEEKSGMIVDVALQWMSGSELEIAKVMLICPNH